VLSGFAITQRNAPCYVKVDHLGDAASEVGITRVRCR
jgi:hypothetical protein